MYDSFCFLNNNFYTENQLKWFNRKCQKERENIPSIFAFDCVNRREYSKRICTNVKYDKDIRDEAWFEECENDGVNEWVNCKKR